MNGWKIAGSGVGGGSGLLALTLNCGVWGAALVVLLAVVVLLVVQRNFRWVLSDRDRIDGVVALRTSKLLPPAGAPNQARPEPPAIPPRRKKWQRRRAQADPSAPR